MYIRVGHGSSTWAVIIKRRLHIVFENQRRICAQCGTPYPGAVPSPADRSRCAPVRCIAAQRLPYGRSPPGRPECCAGTRGVRSGYAWNSTVDSGHTHLQTQPIGEPLEVFLEQVLVWRCYCRHRRPVPAAVSPGDALLGPRAPTTTPRCPTTVRWCHGSC